MISRILILVLAIVLTGCSSSGKDGSSAVSAEGTNTNNPPKEKGLVVKIKHLKGKFLKAIDKSSSRTNIGADKIDGGGFALVTDECADNSGGATAPCDFKLKLRLGPLMGKFDQVAVHFFNDAGKTVQDRYDVIHKIKGKLRGSNQTCREPKLISNSLAVMDLKQSDEPSIVLPCDVLVVKMKANTIKSANKTDYKYETKGETTTEKARNIFYVVEAKSSEKKVCHKLGEPFDSYYTSDREKVCSTADPVIIVRKKGVGAGEEP